MLKSPVIVNSFEVVAAKDRKFGIRLANADGLRVFGCCRRTIDVKNSVQKKV